MISTRAVDVLIVGAGPVGLITAYQLARFGKISVAIIEQQDKTKSERDAYGRAITLYPRSSEMLDQLGLASELAQQCFACRETVTFNSKGEQVEGRGWSFMETAMSDTAWDFALVLRQKYQEDVFRDGLKRYGVEVEAPVTLTGIDVNESSPLLGHKVTATVRNETSGVMSNIRCKFLIGSDGGQSSVRRMMKIPFSGVTTEDRWVRIDGSVRTNHPKPRTYCAIESPTHGNVLWVGLDRGKTRIGYAFTPERENSYEVFDEAAAIKEAKAAVKPFELEFQSVDWWTIYSVGQRVADSFFVKDSVFLAGDACHTHSSGAAQGENTGIHDSVNLAWKLSLVLRGEATFDLLHTYQSERLPNVRRLIEYDKDISRLMTNRLPETWTGDPKADLNETLGQLMREASSFSSGLGIYYEDSRHDLLNVIGSFFRLQRGDVRPGQRAPDVPLLKPGTFEQTRLIVQTPNVARFYVLVFAGNNAEGHEPRFARCVQKSNFLQGLCSRDLLVFLTILPRQVPSAFDVIGHEPLGHVFFDSQGGHAFRRYSLEVDDEVAFVLRPDGWIATMISLRNEAADELESYLKRLIVHSATSL